MRPETPAQASRYRVLGTLGRGAMGSVDLVFDQLVGRRLARKRILRSRAADLIRFKLEFRAVERLVHPNLLRLYELGEDEDGLYFTMDVVDGGDLSSFVREGELEQKLFLVLPQIVEALGFLHANGVVHRDLKPSNVLVTREGQVKLVDFGVLAQLEGRAADEATIAGTPGYMAPEQIRGEPAAPASDVYALGCVLFELLSGRPVFSGTRAEVLSAHLERDPPSLDEVPGIAGAFAAACRAMLAKAAHERPAVSALGSLLLRPLGVTHRPRVESEIVRSDIVGRAEPKARLVAWAREPGGVPRVLAIVGPTGSGKSVLAEWLCEEERARGRVVLTGRSRPSERVAFNAWDAAIDELSHLLARARLDAEIRSWQRSAATAFPVLSQGASLETDRVREAVRQKLFGSGLEPHASRQKVFDAVAHLLDRQAPGPEGVLLLLDDFQWADGDSIALLDHCLEQAGSKLALLLVLRDDVEPGAAATWLAAREGVERLELAPLCEDETAELVERAAAAAGKRLAREEALAAARAAQGRPFLAEVLGRALASGAHGGDAESVLLGLLRRASERERRLLSLLTAADDWVELASLADAAAMPLSEVLDGVERLSQEGLLRRGGAHVPKGRVHLLHDGVRAAALDALSAVEHSAAHDALARQLSARPDAPAERLVRHLLGCGKTGEAALKARDAARAAERQRAFDLAADLYATALLDAPLDREELVEARARALERAGRYVDAVDAWRTLAERARGERKVELLLRESHALIAANRTESGLQRLDETLRAAGHATTRTLGAAAVVTSVRFVLGPRRFSLLPRDPGDLKRGARHVKIGILLSFLDPLSGLSFLQRARRDFVALGADELVAGCDYMFAILALIGSREVERVPLAERYKRAADARLAGRAASPEVRGMPVFFEGLKALRKGDWDEARRSLRAAADIYAESDGTTERMMAMSWSMMADAYTQDLPAMRANYEWFRRHASDCGGTFIVSHSELARAYIEFLEGKFEESWRTMTALADMFDDGRPNTQRAALLIYRHMTDIYRERRPAALREYSLALRRAWRFGFLRSTYAGPFAEIGALLEARGLRTGDRAASRRRLEKYARVVDVAPPLVAGSSARARAYAADACGRPELALRHLLRAEQDARRFGRRVDLEIARYQRGLRLQGDTGRELCADAVRAVEALGASRSVLEEDAGLR